MLSSRPYIARALYEWLLENDNTPYIVVDAMQDDVVVPRQFVQNGQIVLNVSPTAVRDFDISNEIVTFNASFSGEPMQVWVPIPALIAVYSKENGAGMVFGHEPVIPAPVEAVEEETAPVRLESVPTAHGQQQNNSASDGDAASPDDETPPPGGGGGASKGRPALRVVK